MLESKLYKKAYEKYASKNFEEALELIKECKKQMRKKSYLYKNDSTQLQTEITIRMFEGKLYLQLDNHSTARKIFNEIENKLTGKSIEDTGLIAEVYYHLSELEASKNNQKKQSYYLWKAKEKFEEAEKYEEAVDIMFDIVEVEDFNEADYSRIDHYKEIISLSKSIQSKEEAKLNIARARLMVGYLLRNGDPKVASQFLILAHKDFDRLEAKDLKNQALVQLADIKSLTDLNRSIEILKPLLDEIDTDDLFYSIIKAKLTSYQIRAGLFDEAKTTYLDLKNSFEDKEDNIFLANALLESAKSFLLVKPTKENLEYANYLASAAIEIYDKRNQKIGKAIGYLVEGITAYLIQREQSKNSKLKLVHFLAKKIDNREVHNIDHWAAAMLEYLGKTELDAEEITSKLRISEDVPTMMQNAEILHLLGLYKLSNTEVDAAKSLLDGSKDLYERTSKKTGHFDGIGNNIDKIIVDV